MSQSVFHFQQFSIHQDRCGMKVTTDACIQGAWTPISSHVSRILDIGTGTGLLSLMLAQRTSEDVQIDAVEIDPDAADQANENISHSPWANRIKLIQGDIRNYVTTYTYDLIICNPPFFRNSLQAPHKGRNIARHDVHLSLEDLHAAICKLLSPNGFASIILPDTAIGIWENISCAQVGCNFRQLHIKPYPQKPASRIVTLYTPYQQKTECAVEFLSVRENSQQYTLAYQDLLSSFYWKKVFTP